MEPNDANAGSTFGSARASSVMTPSAKSTSPSAHISDSQKSTSASSATIRRRAPIACRRCRRMRTKCIHDRNEPPPCKPCAAAGLGEDDCVFPVRGQPDHDRDFRHPRTRTERAKGTGRRPDDLSDANEDPWESLPPLDDLIDGVHRFTRYYFQLGFIAKKQYPEKLRNDHRSCSLFLLLSILSISARLSPALRGRFGTGVEASDFFMDRASELALAEIYAEPTLERCQAFYLLSIAQQGSGIRNKSYINMGIAIRMANLMMLHREETYTLPNATPDTIIRAESARRTLWMLHSQDNLHSGPTSTVSLFASDITTLLPCDEDDFARGVTPSSRAALDGTQPAKDNPALISDKNRSLFATLMQMHNLWGTVGRRAAKCSRSLKPWDANSQFSRMLTNLNEWESALPARHLFSTDLLRQYKEAGEDLAYLCVTMMTRLCNIVLRRPYLIDVIQRNVREPRQKEFFERMALDLFRNVRGLYEQIDAQFSDRTPDESVGAQIASFCVYSCGLFSSYLCKYPTICPDKSIADAGPMMLARTINILNECKEVWPLAARWADALETFSRNPTSVPLASDGSMDDGQDPIPRAIRSNHPPPISQSAASAAAAAAMPDRALPLPGTQPPSAPSTTTNSPRNVPIQSTIASTPQMPPPLTHYYTSQANHAHSPGAQQLQHSHHLHLNQYQANQSPQQSQHAQQYIHPSQHHSSNEQHLITPHHQVSLQQQTSLQPMAGDSSYHAPATQQSHHLPGIPTGSPAQHADSMFWVSTGAHAHQPLSTNINRHQPDESSMQIATFDNALQQGYTPSPGISQESVIFFPQSLPLRDGFEGELGCYMGASTGENNDMLSSAQWPPTVMFQ